MSERVLEVRPEETFISFDLPLKPETARTLQLLQKLYVQADGSPLEPHYTESLVVLHIPRSIRRQSYGEPTNVETEAAEVHGVPSNG